MKRRTFVKKTALAAGAAALSLPGSRVLGANSDIRMGVIGIGSTIKIGGKGRQDILNFRSIPGVRVTAVCDCDANHLGYEVGQFKKWGEPVKAFTDFRKLLDDPDVDAVSITTPNHWHSLMAILACQAGKDVFVQKPLSHNIFEGRKVIEAAKKHKRIVQATHGPRNNGAIEPALEWIRQGNLGKVRYVRGLNYRPRTSIGKVNGPQPIPEGCNYDLWCGPSEMKPLRREYLHYDWHWDWDTGNGDLGNMGIHFMDGCRWALGTDTLPRHVVTIGGRLGYDDDGETPNTLITLLDYKPVPILFEVRGLPKNASFLNSNWARSANQSMDQFHGMRIGVIIHCEGGSVRFGSGSGCVAYDNQDRQVKALTGQRVSTKQNFIDCIRNRKSEQLHSPAVDGHLSCSLVHLTNISYRVGRSANPEETKEHCRSNKPMSDALNRMLAHLDANRIDLEKVPLQLGPLLTFDPAIERFTGHHSKEANALVSRDYRQPFSVPDEV